MTTERRDNDTDLGGSGQTPTPEDKAQTYSKDAQYWLTCIEDAKKYFSTYNEKCDSIEKLYSDLAEMSKNDGDREFAMFWANIEVLKPTAYARPAVPVVTPRWKDTKDPRRKELNTAAAETLERAIVVTFEQEENQGDAILRQVRDDYLLTGRGVPWARLEAYENIPRVCWEHIDRKDYLESPARKHGEITWKAKRAFMDEKALKARFDGKGPWEKVKMSARPEVEQNSATEHEKKGEVWELWHRTMGLVVWFSPGVSEVLDVQPPLYKLDGFWPAPPPAIGTTQRHSRLPVPDYLYCRDQLEEINEITARISALADGLRLKGFYPGGDANLATAVEKAIKTTQDSAILIPVSNFAALGAVALKDSIVWLPIDVVAEVITNLIGLRKQLFDDVYQILGISDIMRGDTDPDETLGAQQLKSQYGSIRIREKQSELVRVARDMTRITGEIIAENFPLEVIQQMTQMELPTRAEVMQQVQGVMAQAEQLIAQAEQAQADPNMQAMAEASPEQAQAVIAQFQQQLQGMQEQVQQLQALVTIDEVVELLQSDATRPFILDIETDSTIQPDEQAEKAARTEFLAALGGFIQQAGPMVQAQPASAPFVAETLKFVAQGFRAGRALEGAIEQFAQAIKQVAEQAQMMPPPKSPEELKLEAEMKKLESAEKIEMERIGLERQKHADTVQLERDKLGEAAAEREFQEIVSEHDATAQVTIEEMRRRDEMAARQDEMDLKRDDQEIGRATGNADRALQRETANADRKSSDDAAKLKAGVPPGMDLAAAFKELMKGLSDTQETLAETVQQLGQQHQDNIANLQVLTAAVSAPRTVSLEMNGETYNATATVGGE